MSPNDLFDLGAGASFIFFGSVVVYSAMVLRRLNLTSARPPKKGYSRFAAASMFIGQGVVLFGIALAGNSVLGIV